MTASDGVGWGGGVARCAKGKRGYIWRMKMFILGVQVEKRVLKV